jgi:hypothetical protein
MKSKLVWALVALNAVLLVSLIGQWLKPNTAVAQAAGRPSDYIIIPGSIQGSPGQVIYMVDTQNAVLSARQFDGKQFQDMRPIDLRRVFNQTGGNPPAGRTPGRGTTR